MKRLSYIIGVLLPVLAVSCTRESLDRTSSVKDDSPVVVNTPQNALPGEIIVKFTPEMTGVLDRSAAATRSGGASFMTRSGQDNVDDVLDEIGVYSLERVFPANASEETTREEGLHLWYVLKFGEDTDVRTAVEGLSQLGGKISKIQYASRIERKPAHEGVAYSSVRGNAAAGNVSQTAGTPLFPADAESKDQWHYLGPQDNNFGVPVSGGINLPAAWAAADCYGDPEIIVAVMDEGVMWSHPDLAANMWENEGETYKSLEDADGNGYRGDKYGYNFAEDSPAIVWTTEGSTGHGTHVAGTIAAVNGNGGVSGIAGGSGKGDGVKIMSVQIFSGNLGCSTYNEARAIKYAADNGAHILQCSWGYNSYLADPATSQRGYADDDEWMAAAPLEKEAFEYFIHHAGSPNGVLDGGLVIFASGNEYAAAACYPAAYGDFICVAANAIDGTPSSYTNYAMGVDLSAPGGDQDYDYDYDGDGTDDTENDMRVKGSILSTVPPNLYGGVPYAYMDGTSMACPHVSGVAALGLSYAAKLHKHFTADQFKELILRSVRPFGDNMLSGYKLYHKYATEVGNAIPVRMDLSGEYYGNMGAGIIDAEMLMELVEDDENGVKLSLPNIYLRPEETRSQSLRRFFDDGENLEYEVTVEDGNIAGAQISGMDLIVTAKSAGSTKFTVTPSEGEPQTAWITVRNSAGDNGWL